MDFIHQLITNEVPDDRVSSVYVYTVFFHSREFSKQFSLIIDQPRLLGWMLPLLSKFWHKWERLYWIIQRSTPFVIHTVYVFFSISNFFLPTYWRCKNSFILFLSSIFFTVYSLMESWLTRMNSLDSILICYASVTFIQEKNIKYFSSNMITRLYILRTINALILLTFWQKMNYDTLILLIECSIFSEKVL